MKKYWWAWVVIVLILGAIIWGFLGVVEESGRESALIVVLKGVLCIFGLVVFMAFNVFYFSDKAMPKKLDGWIKKQCKLVQYTFLALWLGLYLFIVLTGYKFASWCSSELDYYQFETEFEHKHNIDL